jgi:hypothetical protein
MATIIMLKNLMLAFPALAEPQSFGQVPHPAQQRAAEAA